MSTLSRNTSVKRAINAIKNSDYKGKYVKVELEANLSRTETESYCKNFIIDRLSQEHKNNIVYSRFYNDGSVDSEFTFTVPIDKLDTVIEVINAFKEMAEHVSNGYINVDGAGMHIAILNSNNGTYPSGNELLSPYKENFAHAMTKLLPALYFLGTCSTFSRRLEYRRPMINLGNKYSAITGHRGVFEYRFFDTCYDNPEGFYDYICVIAKTLQFYTVDPPKLPFDGKYGSLIIKDDPSYNIKKFYKTAKHLDVLDAGLSVLKPNHKTIKQLKQERKFDVDKSKLKAEDQKLENRFLGDYPQEKKNIELLAEQFRKTLSDYFDSESALGFLEEKDKNTFISDQMGKWYKQKGFDFIESPQKYVNKKRQDLLKNAPGMTYEINV